MATYDQNGPYTKGTRLNDSLRYGAQPKGQYSASADGNYGDALERLLAAAKNSGADYLMIAVYSGKRPGDGASIKPYNGKPGIPGKYNVAGKQYGVAGEHGGELHNCPQCGFNLAPFGGSGSIDDKVLGKQYRGAAGGQSYKQGPARSGSYRN
jgi:hypothetical protein